MPSIETQSMEQYVTQNRDTLVEVLRHCDDNYTRACALAMLKNGGDARDIELVRRELAEI